MTLKKKKVPWKKKPRKFEGSLSKLKVTISVPKQHFENVHLAFKRRPFKVHISLDFRKSNTMHNRARDLQISEKQNYRNVFLSSNYIYFVYTLPVIS